MAKKKGVSPPEPSQSLKRFNWRNTGLCAPSDSAFQAWLATIEEHSGGSICSREESFP